MTVRKTSRQGPGTRKPGTKQRQGQPAKSGVQAKRATADAATAKKTRKSIERSQAAAPLLAHTAKKTGPLDQASRAKKPQAHASYQPKTRPPAAAERARTAGPYGAVDVLALARPWMTLGWRMTAAGFALQTRMAKAALEMPPPAVIAMRQGAEALNAWFAMMQARPSKARKD